MAQTVLIWTCVFVFIATSAITLLGLINKISIDRSYLNKLFFLLILEIVPISILVFKNGLNPQAKNVKSNPSQDSWIALNRTSGEALPALQLLQDTTVCGLLSPNSKNLDLVLRMDKEHQISIENGVALGKLNSKDVNDFCSNTCDFAKTAPIAPDKSLSFTPKIPVNPFSINLGFCIKESGILFFRINNKKGIEADYEKDEGNLIRVKQTKTFFVDEQKYFISCIEYDTQIGISKFVIGIL